MSVAEEAARQQRNFRELLQSGDDEWFKARFTAVGEGSPATWWKSTWACATGWRFCHAKRSKHYVGQKYGEFFTHIEGLATNGHVLGLEETKAYMKGLPQLPNASFRRLLREASTFTQEPAQKQPASNQIGLSNVSAATKTTGNQGQTPSVAPAGDGNLESHNKKQDIDRPNYYNTESCNFVF
jgi:hypothetical protein